jgi:geranylgeranyl pyrophosphate synthase
LRCRLDDIQDGSPLRRGKLAAHTLFGVPQTINSANLAIIEAIDAARGLEQPDAMEIMMSMMLQHRLEYATNKGGR